MSPATDLTTRILAEMREESRAFREEMRSFKDVVMKRFDDVDKRFDDVDSRFVQVFGRLDELSHRIDNTNMHLIAMDARLSTEISALRGISYAFEPKQDQLEDRVARCEDEIEQLRRR